MQIVMPTLTKVVLHFKCYVQSALAVLFGRVENYLILKSNELQK